MIGMPWPGLVIAANDIGSHWPGRLDAWVTLHANNLPKWAEHRAAFGHPPALGTYSSRRHRGITHTVPTWAGGASGMLAMSVAIDQLHCTRVVLCGIPMTATPHFAESKQHQAGRKWGSANGHWKAWQRMAKDKMRNVRSMSGRTMELLGAPTREWILGTEDGEVAA